MQTALDSGNQQFIDFAESAVLAGQDIQEVAEILNESVRLEEEYLTFLSGVAGSVLRQFNQIRRAQEEERKAAQDLILSDEARRGLEIKLQNERVEFLSNLSDTERAALVGIVSDVEIATADLLSRVNAEQEVLNENIIQSADAFDAAKESIRGFLEELNFSEFSDLLPIQQLERAEQQFNSTLARARAGDSDALSEITGLAQRFLEM